MGTRKRANAASTGERISLDVEKIRVDATPEAVATMMSALIHIPSYRKRFEKNPVAHLKEVGIAVPRDVAKQITPESIRMTLVELTEGGEEREAAPFPIVMISPRVGTRPAVNVGVRVATRTRTFASPLAERSERPGLARRQKRPREE